MKRILLVDDHEVVRVGLKKIFAEEFSQVIVGEAALPQEAIQLAGKEDWDLIVLELSLGRNSGLDVLKQIKRIQPKVPVLILTGTSEQQYALRAIKAGAAGYVTKISYVADLLQAVKKVVQGGRYISPSLAETLSAHLQDERPEAIHELLSDREFQVMRLIGSGKTVGQIAVMLSISDKTVSTYRARILEKTGMKNNAQVIRYVVERGFFD